MSDEIREAREIMWAAFEADPDFKRTYRDNVAMLLYDEGVVISKEARNDVAIKIINLIFN